MASAIKSVSYFMSSPASTCDRCGQGIKHVALVAFKDGETQRYGLDCVDKILASAPDLKGLFSKNIKRLRTYQDYLAILTGPAASMPRGQEYFNSGLFFIADSSGKDIMFDNFYFHPVFDQEKNGTGKNYVVNDPASHVTRCAKDIADKLPKLRAEIERIEGFLARVIAKGIAVSNLKLQESN